MVRGKGEEREGGKEEGVRVRGEEREGRRGEREGWKRWEERAKGRTERMDEFSHLPRIKKKFF